MRGQRRLLSATISLMMLWEHIPFGGPPLSSIIARSRFQMSWDGPGIAQESVGKHDVCFVAFRRPVEFRDRQETTMCEGAMGRPGRVRKRSLSKIIACCRLSQLAKREQADDRANLAPAARTSVQATVPVPRPGSATKAADAASAHLLPLRLNQSRCAGGSGRKSAFEAGRTQGT